MERYDKGAETPGGIAALSRPSRVVVAVAALLTAAAATVHVAMVFLHLAPSNTVTERYGEAVDAYVYPEFEQNWKLFAPNPLQQNIAVQARAEIRAQDGGTVTTEWTDLSAQDGAAIRHDPFPSHVQQNELRRGWDFFVGSHDDANRPDGLRGRLSEQYIRRIVMLRFGAEEEGGTVERVQVRSATTPVAPPRWSEEKIDTKTVYRVLPWWRVTGADLPEAAGASDEADAPEAAGASGTAVPDRLGTAGKERSTTGKETRNR